MRLPAIRRSCCSGAAPPHWGIPALPGRSDTAAVVYFVRHLGHGIVSWDSASGITFVFSKSAFFWGGGEFFFYYIFYDHFYFPAQRRRDFTLSDLFWARRGRRCLPFFPPPVRAFIFIFFAHTVSIQHSQFSAFYARRFLLNLQT